MLSSAAHIEARVKRVLEITHVDSTLLEHLETLSAVFEDLPRGGVAGGGGGSLRSEIDKRALQVAQEFLNQLAPIEAHVRELAEAVDAVGSAAASSLARAEADERVSAAFLLAATDTARQRAHVQTEITRLRELAALYSLRAEDVEALEKGPDGAGDDFFEALDRVDAIRARALRMLSDTTSGSVETRINAVESSSSAAASARVPLASEHALGLELLGTASAAQNRALDDLFEWALARCRSADTVFTAAEGDVDAERIAVLGAAAMPSPEREARALRRALTFLSSLRPAFCRACQDAATLCRRGAFVKAFVRALSSGGGSAGLGSPVGQVRGRPIDASAHDAVRYVSDLCAWVHLHMAEEEEAFTGAFRLALAVAAAQAQANGSEREGGVEADLEREKVGVEADEGGGGSDTLAASVSVNATSEVSSSSLIGGFSGRLASASALLSESEMVTGVTDGLARPLALRIEQVITSPSTNLPVAVKLVDILAFYVRTLGKSLSPTSALLAGLRSVHDRAVSRVEELLQIQAGRLREVVPSFPTTLSVTPLVADVIALAEDILRTHEASLAYAGVGMMSGGGAQSGSGNSSSGHIGLVGLGVLDITRIIEMLVDPALKSGHASTQGLRLIDSATFLCNQVSAVQTALAPFAGAVRIVQRLAAELSAYEESMVQTLSESVLSETGMLAKLALLRAPREANVRIANVVGLRAEDIRSAVAAFVAEFSSSGTGPLSVFDRIDNPRARSRLRQDASTILLEAYCVIEAAINTQVNGYGADVAKAILPPHGQMAILLELK